MIHALSMEGPALDIEPSAISAPTVEGPALDIEPSAIQALTVEGPALNIEPSTISTFSADGSTPDTRTVHDSGPKRGRSSFGHRTVRDIDLQRGWFNT